MKLLFCGLFLLFPFQTHFACVNGKYELKPLKAAPTVAEQLQQSLQRNLALEGEQMEATLRAGTDFEQRMGYAVALIYLGRNQEAVTLLQKLEKEKPGEYPIAANLGTAYELSGDNASALRWIKEGIRRNPNSHHGTEWLHVRILEAKIAQSKDPKYFDGNSVLDLQPAADGNKNYFVVGGQAMPREDLRKALQYQLSERLQFVKNADMPVASLLFDYAKVEAAGNTLESARDLLKLALQFGYPAEKGKPILNSYRRAILWTKAGDIAGTVLLVAAVIGIIGFLFVKWVNRPLYA